MWSRGKRTLVSPSSGISAGASQQEGLQACSEKSFLSRVLPPLCFSEDGNSTLLACHLRKGALALWLSAFSQPLCSMGPQEPVWTAKTRGFKLLKTC